MFLRIFTESVKFQLNKISNKINKIQDCLAHAKEYFKVKEYLVQKSCLRNILP